MQRKALQPLIWIIGGILAVLWWQTTPPGLLGKADAIGYAVCHRIDVRSFHLGARAIPLCARCTGMYAGAMLGLLYQHWRAPRHSALPPHTLWLPLGVLVAAFGADGLNSYLHFFPNAPGLYQPNNILRLLTGTGIGLVMASFVYPAFQDTMWQQAIPKPALKDGRDLVVLLMLGLVVDALILTENPLLLYPLALLSAAGVLILLSMIYGMLWVMLWRAERFATRTRQLLPPILVGLTLGLLQIAVLDYLRYRLTGTWDGFHLG